MSAVNTLSPCRPESGYRYAATVYLTENGVIIIFTTKMQHPQDDHRIDPANLRQHLETATDGSGNSFEMGTYEFRTADTGEIATFSFEG